ncbi:M15 family metallopeptidase [Legionella pneumophila]|uniref:M15 family metallopeptidase n=1 Tax=Legionella pneumophila TaxID=446 RepID=UPI00277BDCAD|nr:D-alanyl-D-alanine dipeptidase [Legionella pneumophila]
MKPIAHIADKEIISILVKECGEELIDLKNQNIIVYGPPPETPLTANDYTKIRKTVYQKLCLAQNDLPNGWRFRLYEGLRSLTVQEILFNQQRDNLRQSKQYDSYEDLFNETCRLVSPVVHLDGTANVPPHSTGAAIDIELIDSYGNLVNLGMAAKDWLIVDPDLSETYSKLISEEAMQNRILMLKIMAKHGFVNYPREWWHFSYGDRLWAYMTEHSTAIYGAIINN